MGFGSVKCLADWNGSFSILNWTGYPANLPKPTGLFRLISGEAYKVARMLKDAANKRFMPNKSANVHIHEMHPVKFNGSPIDPE